MKKALITGITGQDGSYLAELLIGKGYQTFPVLIYNSYVGETSTNHYFAAAISVIGIAVTAVIFLIQKFASSRFTFTMNALHSIEKRKPGRLVSILIHAYCYILVAVAFMPQLFATLAFAEYIAPAKFASSHVSNSGALYGLSHSWWEYHLNS